MNRTRAFPSLARHPFPSRSGCWDLNRRPPARELGTTKISSRLSGQAVDDLARHREQQIDPEHRRECLLTQPALGLAGTQVLPTIRCRSPSWERDHLVAMTGAAGEKIDKQLHDNQTLPVTPLARSGGQAYPLVTIADGSEHGAETTGFHKRWWRQFDEDWPEAVREAYNRAFTHELTAARVAVVELAFDAATPASGATSPSSTSTGGNRLSRSTRRRAAG
jgi:hypothetical protein